MSGVRTVLLKDICDFEKGTTGLMKAISGEFPLVTTGAERRTCESYQFDTKAVCIPLVSSTGHGHASLNNVHYQEGKFSLGTIIVALTAKNELELDVHFLHLYLSQLKDIVLVPLMKGAANVSLSITAIKGVEIPLPSFDRQKEIVVKFKSVVQEEKAILRELINQKKLLKLLKPQILKEAIEGKLTKKWRVKNNDIERASDLHKRILNERKSWLSESISNGYKEAKVYQNKITKLDKSKIVLPAKAIPETWEWLPLLDVMNLIVDCHNKTAPYVEKGMPLIRTTNVRDGLINLTGAKFITKDTYDFWSKRCKPLPGDIIYTREAPVGEAGILPEGEVICMGQRMMLLRPNHNLLDNKFILYSLIEPDFLNRLEDLQVGAMVKHLRVGNVENAMIALPPLLEQKKIVSKVDELLKIYDQLSDKLTENHGYANKLMEVVLKEEFARKD